MATVSATYQGCRFKKNTGDAIGGWGVWRFWSTEHGDFAATGTMETETLVSGIDTILEGEWVTSKYGRQFKFRTASVPAPNGRKGTITFLQLAPGVGPVLATRAWEEYGEAAIDRAIADPAEVFGSSKKNEKIRDVLQSHLSEASCIVPLLGLFDGTGAPKSLAKTVATSRLSNALSSVERDPFMLMQFPGVSFGTCDKVRRRLQLPPDVPGRAPAAIVAAFRDRSSDVWVWSPRILNDVANLLSLPSGETKKVINEAVKCGDLEYHDKLLSLAINARREREIAARISMIMAADSAPWPDASTLENLSDHQRQVADTALSGNIAVLMGSAGTGKTRTAAAIVGMFHHSEVTAVAPTGKAAQQLTRAMRGYGLNVVASTIHSALRAIPTKTGWKFSVDGADGGFLPGKLIVVDEASMLSDSLNLHLLRAVRPGSRILYIGDPHQLPPIECGAFLRDWSRWCESEGTASFGELTQVLRNEGKIVARSRDVSNGVAMPADKVATKAVGVGYNLGSNLQMISVSSPQKALRAVSHIVDNVLAGKIKLANGDRLAPLYDLQCLVANNEGSLVARKELNRSLQHVLNPAIDAASEHGPHKYRVLDRMICLKNDTFKSYSSARLAEPDGSRFVANGEMGHCVIACDDYIRMTLESEPGVYIDIPPDKLLSFDLGYAITVHRAQGSQFKVVIIVLPGGHRESMVVDRSWLYTAITRAEDLCIIVSNSATISKAVRKVDISKRKTRLVELLTKECCNEEGIQSP